MKKMLVQLGLTAILIVSYLFLVGCGPLNYPVVMGKFSYGGIRLTITNNNPEATLITITSLIINYCDGTNSQLWENLYPREYGFTYIADRPMRRVKIVTTNPKVIVDGIPRLVTEVKRKCSNPLSPPKLYCNNVNIAEKIYRDIEAPLSFISTRFVFNAGIRIPEIDGIIWVRKVNTYPYLGKSRSLKFQASGQEWTGTFPSVYIPIGKYRNVELIVQDEYGQQAKCRIGNLEILP